MTGAKRWPPTGPGPRRHRRSRGPADHGPLGQGPGAHPQADQRGRRPAGDGHRQAGQESPSGGPLARPGPGHPSTSAIEVFADIWCPFSHVGLRAVRRRRRELGRSDVNAPCAGLAAGAGERAPLDPARHGPAHRRVGRRGPRPLRRIRPGSLSPDHPAGPGPGRGGLSTGRRPRGGGQRGAARRPVRGRPGHLGSRGAGRDGPGLLAGRRARDADAVLADWHEGQTRGVRGSPTSSGSWTASARPSTSAGTPPAGSTWPATPKLSTGSSESASPADRTRPERSGRAGSCPSALGARCGTPLRDRPFRSRVRGHRGPASPAAAELPVEGLVEQDDAGLVAHRRGWKSTRPVSRLAWTSSDSGKSSTAVMACSESNWRS